MTYGIQINKILIPYVKNVISLKSFTRFTPVSNLIIVTKQNIFLVFIKRLQKQIQLVYQGV